PDAVSRCLEEAGIAFMFAPVFHSAMAHAAGPRREMGIPTVFNFLGPLTNPARPAAQVVGVSDERMQPVLAGVLSERGTRAYVVHGQDGLDEITTTGASIVYETGLDEPHPSVLDPSDYGLDISRKADLEGGDAAHNAEVARKVLSGDHGPIRDIVILNAAAALTVAGLAKDLQEGLAVAAESTDSGKASATLEKWIEVSNLE
ncbi:MAG TPA: anthranilate phosphoribosyltransferase, partial [Actinomycetota bacterium]|nr:anthranilate phosphoribosyltransferase [Actinomycetota bacterium]